MTPTPQRRRRRSDLDAIVDIVRRMDPEERRLVIPVLKGIERFSAARPASADEQQTFEELGAAAAEVME